jgi:hypothetical protein
MEELASAEVVKDAGFEGCAHARLGNRQVLVDAETLGAFQLEPGIIPKTSPPRDWTSTVWPSRRG